MDHGAIRTINCLAITWVRCEETSLFFSSTLPVGRNAWKMIVLWTLDLARRGDSHEVPRYLRRSSFRSLTLPGFGTGRALAGMLGILPTSQPCAMYSLQLETFEAV